MQIHAKKLRGYTLDALDGEIGKVKDLYFDDEWWGVRYFVVKTGPWLGGREVLISVQSVRPGEWPHKAWPHNGIPVQLSCDEVQHSPPVDTAQPISRHYEQAHAAHYRNDYYWNGPHAWAAGPFGTMLGTEQPRTGAAGGAMDEVAAAERAAAEHSHLRSLDEVLGYDVVGNDDVAGKLDDLLVDCASWRITELVVDTHPWLPGGQVVVEPGTVDHINWSTGAVRLNVSRKELKQSPGIG